MIFRYPGYLLIYIVMFGLLGLVLSGTANTETVDKLDFYAQKQTIAVIDRDHSEVSLGLTSFLDGRHELIVLEDQIRVLQDAIAQNRVSWVLIIVEGFENDFMAAVRDQSAVPGLSSIVSVNAISGIYLDNQVSNYLNALRVSAMINPDATPGMLVDRAHQVAAMNTSIEVVQASENVNRDALFPYYLRFTAYPLTIGVGMLVALLFSGFRNGELRRRNASAPVRSLRINSQIALAGLVVVFLTWIFLCSLSFLPVIGGLNLLKQSPGVVLLMFLTVLLYSLFSLALGFLLSQFGLAESSLNGLMNIVSLAMLFLSGIMMGSTGYLEGVMLTIGRFIPCYWYAEAISALAGASDLSWISLQYYLTCLGVMLLFTAAVFSIALLTGSLQTQTAEAGGNSAAEVA
jgi:ABC-2 type transport system permease protein